MLSAMRGPRKKLAGEEPLYQAALRALMRRAHSVWEMRKYLEDRAEEKSRVRRVLDRLKQQSYLDDERYAAQFARARAEGRRQGRFRIARELRARGVPDRHIDAALEAVFADADEALAVRQCIERKLRSARAPLDEKRLASLYRSLLRAGFSADVIRTELRARTKADIEALAAEPADDAE
jgi:regulatory protein